MKMAVKLRQAVRAAFIRDKANHTGMYSAANVAKRRQRMILHLRASLAKDKANHTGIYSPAFKARMKVLAHAAVERKLHSPAYKAKMRAVAKANWARMPEAKKQKIRLYLMFKSGEI